MVPIEVTRAVAVAESPWIIWSHNIKTKAVRIMARATSIASVAKFFSSVLPIISPKTQR